MWTPFSRGAFGLSLGSFGPSGEAVLTEYTYVDHLPGVDENTPKRRASDAVPAGTNGHAPAAKPTETVA
ncbi:MAG: hypothetical protein KGJ84_11695 [Elusimicrobia bacterium]|nr:hypothetical protein [Elusimicrobiota bacterium]